MGTVSSISDKNAQQFDGSATPDLVLIDSEYRDVIWIDVKHPSQWDKTVYDQLNEAWRSSEKIGYYFVEETKEIDLPEIVKDSVRIKPVVDKKSEAIERLQKQIDSLKSIGN